LKELKKKAKFFIPSHFFSLTLSFLNYHRATKNNQKYYYHTIIGLNVYNIEVVERVKKHFTSFVDDAIYVSALATFLSY